VSVAGCASSKVLVVQLFMPATANLVRRSTPAGGRGPYCDAPSGTPSGIPLDPVDAADISGVLDLRTGRDGAFRRVGGRPPSAECRYDAQ